MATVALRPSGHLEVVELAAATLTASLTAHSGKVINATVSTVITLPAVATMHRYAVRVGKEGITVAISPNASDLIAGAGAANTGAGADNKDISFVNQPSGSYVVLEYGDANGWAIVEQLGTLTFEA